MSVSQVLTTQVGDIDLRIPKLRLGSFLPLILTPRGHRGVAHCLGGGNWSSRDPGVANNQPPIQTNDLTSWLTDTSQA